MTHIHVNKELTDDLESQGYHLVDKHQLARMQALEKVARAARTYMNAYQAASDLTVTGTTESAKLHHEKREAWVNLRNTLEQLK